MVDSQDSTGSKVSQDHNGYDPVSIYIIILYRYSIPEFDGIN